MAEQTMLNQPVSDIQLHQLQVEWVPITDVKPNTYNPNKMTWHDRMLLRQSLLEDGWTQPIVTLLDGTIVDGEQRWTTAGMEIEPNDIQEIIDKMYEREQEGAVLSESILARLTESLVRIQAVVDRGEKATIASVTGGLVPITRVDFKDEAHRMISTIRHNRARGTHKLDSMSGITADLVALGMDVGDLETRLGMDDEEINRLLDSAAGLAQADALLDMTDDEFSAAWEPVHIAELELDDDIRTELALSAEAAAATKEHQLDLARRSAEVGEQIRKEVAERREAGEKITQDDQEKIAKKVEKSIPKPAKPPKVVLKKFSVFVLPDEYEIIVKALGAEDRAARLIALCRAIVDDAETESVGH